MIILSKFDDDWTKTVASRVFTSQKLTHNARRTDAQRTDDRQRPVTIAHHEHFMDDDRSCPSYKLPRSLWLRGAKHLKGQKSYGVDKNVSTDECQGDHYIPITFSRGITSLMLIMLHFFWGSCIPQGTVFSQIILIYFTECNYDPFD